MLEILAAVLVIILPVALAIIPLKYDLFLPNTKRLSKAGWGFITISVIGIFSSFTDKYFNNEDNNSLKLVIEELKFGKDSLSIKADNLEKIVKDNGIKTDAITGRLIKIDSQGRITPIIVIAKANKDIDKPTLQICVDNPPNPTIKETPGGKVFHIDYESINFKSHINSYRFLIFTTKITGDLDKPIIVNGSYTNWVSTIIPKTAANAMFFLNRTVMQSKNFYVVFEVRFSNSMGKRQPLFQHMYYINFPATGMIIPGVNDVKHKEIANIIKAIHN